MEYTENDSKIGEFAKLSAPDFLTAKQAISEGDMADAVGEKDGDDKEGKKTSFESFSV